MGLKLYEASALPPSHHGWVIYRVNWMAFFGCRELIYMKAWNGCQGCLVEYEWIGCQGCLVEYGNGTLLIVFFSGKCQGAFQGTFLVLGAIARKRWS